MHHDQSAGAGPETAAGRSRDGQVPAGHPDPAQRRTQHQYDFGPEAVFVAAPPRPNVSPLEGAQYFGQVDIDPQTEQLTVSLKGIDGQALFTQVLDPAAR